MKARIRILIEAKPFAKGLEKVYEVVNEMVELAKKRGIEVKVGRRTLWREW